jgi:hypothetical protein
MPTVKEHLKNIADSLPDGATWEEDYCVMRNLLKCNKKYFLQS